MRKRIFLVAAAASVLGFSSPFIGQLGGGFADPVSHHGIFYAWFFVAVAAVDQLVWPETDAGMLVLAVAVYTVQYVALFLLMWATVPVTRILGDFLAGARHRRSRLIR